MDEYDDNDIFYIGSYMFLPGTFLKTMPRFRMEECVEASFSRVEDM